MLFASISWSPDPTIIDLFGFPVRWYGLFFASAFLAGFQIVSYMFKQEGKSTDQADQLLMYKKYFSRNRMMTLGIRQKLQNMQKNWDFNLIYFCIF